MTSERIADIVSQMDFELSSLGTWTKPGYPAVNITRVRDTERKIRRWKATLEAIADGEAQ